MEVFVEKSSRVHSDSIRRHFRSLRDPRTRAGKIKHSLANIVFMSLCAAIAGADDTVAVAEFARLKRDWFSNYLDLPRDSDGELCTPSHDTFERVLTRLDPIAYQKCLINWTRELHDITGGKLVAIDGKVVREALKRSGDQGALTLVSAWSSENALMLGQVAGAKGSNELSALSPLLSLLELKGSIVTIDAIGCQKEILKQIVEAKGDYVISVKGNQESLFGVVLDAFSEALERTEVGEPSKSNAMKSHTTTEKGHGRTDVRTTTVINAPEQFTEKELWQSIKTFVRTTRITTDSSGKETSGVRYYVSSLSISAARMAAIVRNHWTIENQLHWQLDVTYREDASRARTGNLQANLGVLRRVSLSLLKNADRGKRSVRLLRQAAAWDDDVIESIVFGAKATQT